MSGSRLQLFFLPRPKTIEKPGDLTVNPLQRKQLENSHCGQIFCRQVMPAFVRHLRERVMELQPVLQFVAKFSGFTTAAIFVSAMFVYFRTGPKKRGDFLSSSAVLAFVAAHMYFIAVAADLSVLRSSIAILLFVVANTAFWTAVVAHKANRPGAAFGESVPSFLVTTGPYRVVRHPFYLAYLLAFAGSSCVGYHWWLFASTALLFVVYNAAAVREERLLCQVPQLAEAYTAYRTKTWRWLPFVW